MATMVSTKPSQGQAEFSREKDILLRSIYTLYNSSALLQNMTILSPLSYYYSVLDARKDILTERLADKLISTIKSRSTRRR